MSHSHEEVGTEFCKLCRKVGKLEESHTIPAFVFRWIKETSATGYLRFGVNPNKRLQDGFKSKLLCRDCESLFSSFERPFSNNIFYPYVREELSSDGVCQGKIASFQYDSWLLKFLISLQWRVLVTPFDENDAVKITRRQSKLLEEIEPVWRDFLLGRRQDTGMTSSYMLFFQSMLGVSRIGSGVRVASNVNTYLLRAVDRTQIVGKRTLISYVKIGPIAFLTSHYPEKLSGMPGARVLMKGSHSLTQDLRNSELNSYIYRFRPKELQDVMNFSEQQKRLIHEAWIRNPSRSEASMSFAAKKADLTFKEIHADNEDYWIS